MLLFATHQLPTIHNFKNQLPLIMLKTNLTLLISLCLMSCTSTKKLHDRIMEEELNLHAYENENYPLKIKDLTVSLNTSVNGLQFPNNTEIVKDKGYVLPFLVYNTWKSKNTLTMGKDIMDDTVEVFVNHILVDKIENLSYAVIGVENESKYSLEINIDTIQVSGPYESSGYGFFLLFAYGYGISDMAGPATTRLALSYNLMKNDSSVLQNSVANTFYTKQASYQYSSKSTMQGSYATKMVQTLSANIDFVCNQVILDINQYFLTIGKPRDPSKKIEKFDPEKPLIKLRSTF